MRHLAGRYELAPPRPIRHASGAARNNRTCRCPRTRRRHANRYGRPTRERGVVDGRRRHPRRNRRGISARRSRIGRRRGVPRRRSLVGYFLAVHHDSYSCWTEPGPRLPTDAVPAHLYVGVSLHTNNRPTVADGGVMTLRSSHTYSVEVSTVRGPKKGTANRSVIGA